MNSDGVEKVTKAFKERYPDNTDNSIPHALSPTSLYDSVVAHGYGYGPSHRGGRWSCCHCGYDPDIKNHDIWFIAPWIQEIIFRCPRTKGSSAVVISMCPECGELSWEHVGLDHLISVGRLHESGPINIEIIKSEERHRARESYLTWLNGTCRICAKLESVEGNLYNDYGIVTSCERMSSSFGDHKEYPSGDICKGFVQLPEGKFNIITEKEQHYWYYNKDRVWDLVPEEAKKLLIGKGYVKEEE